LRMANSFKILGTFFVGGLGNVSGKAKTNPQRVEDLGFAVGKKLRSRGIFFFACYF
jgi:hypothetical protein